MPGSYIEAAPGMGMMDMNDCGRSMNSEAFSHFSLPSNNLVNGLRVNVPQSNSNFRPPENQLLNQSMGSSSDFSSMIKSQATVNQTSVNLGQPLQMCQSNYDNAVGTSSYYVTEDSF